jgi:bifunctional DNA-binding transcriptional regulator/antitoxin component of YhaV-PrlF toxin-antitoxin module
MMSAEAWGKYAVTEKVGRSIVAVSRLFQHGKTQVPKEVRHALGLKDGDKIVWVLDGGKWVVESAEK